jgi:energy-coupling factor transporter ATP-binding protein EcfA2
MATCEERIPLNRLQYAYSLDKQFYTEKGVFDREKSEKEKNIWMNVIRKYLKQMILSKGFHSFNYFPSLKSQEGECGRLFGKQSIQNIHSVIRGFLVEGFTTDIDMKNAHCVIALYLAKKYEKPYAELLKYVNERDAVLDRYGKQFKTIILEHLNKDTGNVPASYPDEIKSLIRSFKPLKELINHPDFNHIHRISDDEASWNIKGSKFNRILCFYEAKILRIVASVLHSKNIPIFAYMFDGLLAYGNFYDDAQLLIDIENEIELQIPDMNMKFAYKPHNTSIVLPPSYTTVPVDRFFENEIKTFDEVCSEFEKNCFKVINKSLFIMVDNTDKLLPKLIYKKERDLKVSFNHLNYEEVEEDKSGNEKITKHSFIDRWIKGYESIRSYRDVDMYPPPLVCPKKDYNLWTPYLIERMDTPYSPDIEGCTFIMNHFKIMCDHNEEVYEYFIRWVGQMLKFPGIKSGKCPVFIGGQGAGKGTMFKIFNAIMGDDKTYLTPEPDKYVYGAFNNSIETRVLIGLDECEKKVSKDYSQVFKNYITEPTITINQKNFEQRIVKSYHRYIIFSNNEEPIVIEENDRRFFVVRISDEKMGDAEYFTKLHSYIKNTNTMRSVYEYFTGLDRLDEDEFMKMVMPITDFKKSIQEITSDPLKLWSDELVEYRFKELYEYNDDGELTNVQGVELTTSTNDLFENYKKWLNECGYVNKQVVFNSFRARLGRIKHHKIIFSRTPTHRFVKILTS